ncbi:transcription initiation factor IIH5 [Dictyostelium discoideum AX4]|uniref:General transcription factor IIH subunit 5 n=2 Tax=Dictyostelium TaxID=5782 RepID=TF2H5_DICDI|nr:transcription initiation factor IIH5 [Dictyostelium discoideum AX4]Q55CT8.1 RecName: Full=General transcription factor IIH subunit 5; AltName: Full=TFIIH basal transcription factor complex subunit 5 [Dictyostelium discoideum]EAL72303.1 transcription initiation factor IIH5 [Dictyostelium discoideum AX4]|eukprot:XP_646393.1 transcription initiation factor IIH5 [Dictyostelium discoideum AX4]
MVHVYKGLFLECDPPTKQFVEYISKQEHFEVIVLDETHLFLQGGDEKVINSIQRRIDDLQNQNTYSVFDKDQ